MSTLIDNPILNSPFIEPTRHFTFDDEGITNEILKGRRPSSHFVPDAFLIVTPGITIRDRLRVLLPTDPDNYYRQRDILPSDLLEPSPFLETPDQVVRRVCRDLACKKNIVVMNDEAHHGYRRRPEAEAETLTGEERQEAAKRDEEARVWVSGLEAVKNKIGMKATPHEAERAGCRVERVTPFLLCRPGFHH